MRRDAGAMGVADEGAAGISDHLQGDRRVAVVQGKERLWEVSEGRKVGGGAGESVGSDGGAKKGSALEQWSVSVRMVTVVGNGEVLVGT